MSIQSMASALRWSLLFLTYSLAAVAAEHDANDSDREYCEDLVTPRAVQVDELVEPEDFYFCHPSIPNGYLKCIVGVSEEAIVDRFAESGRIVYTSVLDEKELMCGADLYFNTEKQACMPHPISNCARIFDRTVPSKEQVLCAAYRDSLSTVESSLVAHLICHNKEKQSFVVCPANTASAVVVPCVNGTYFSQSLGKCVDTEEQSDCPIEWTEMDRVNAVGEMRMKLNPQCECICKKLLASCSDNVVYAGCPEDATKFLICTRTGPVHKGGCPAGLFWNDDLSTCAHTGSLKPVSGCTAPAPAPAMPTESAAGDVIQRQQCECAKALQASGSASAYICDPEAKDHFLVCTPDNAVPQHCPPGTFWNSDSKACSTIRKCSPFMCATPAPLMPTAPTTTKPHVQWRPIPTTTTTTAAPPVVWRPLPPSTAPASNQHGCIDCNISPRQRCECGEALRRSGAESAYLCDPESEDRFLICTGKTVICQPCAKGTFWNADAKACAPVRRCGPAMCANTMRPTTTTTTTTPYVPPTTPYVPPTTPYVPPTTPYVPPTTPYVPPTTPYVPPSPVYPTYVPFCQYFYEYHPEKMNWLTAKRVCEANQGTLVTIPDQGTQQLLRDRYGSTSKSKRVWIGATDRNREGAWEWVTGERFGFTNWYRNQPSLKRDEDCLAFNYYEEGAWSDEECDQIKPFICQNLVCSKK